MSYIGKETQITIGGKVYTLSRLTRSVLKDFSQWVHAHTPDPLAKAAQHIKDFPPELQKLLLQQAWSDSKARLDIEGPEVREAMNTIEGSTRLFQLLLVKHHPELTEDDTFDLAQQYFFEQLEERVKSLLAQHSEWTEQFARQVALEEVSSSGTFRLDLPAVPGYGPDQPVRGAEGHPDSTGTSAETASS